MPCGENQVLLSGEIQHQREGNGRKKGRSRVGVEQCFAVGATSAPDRGSDHQNNYGQASGLDEVVWWNGPTRAVAVYQSGKGCTDRTRRRSVSPARDAYRPVGRPDDAIDHAQVSACFRGFHAVLQAVSLKNRLI